MIAPRKNTFMPHDKPSVLFEIVMSAFSPTAGTVVPDDEGRVD